MQASIFGALSGWFPLVSNKDMTKIKSTLQRKTERLKKLSGFYSLPPGKISKLTLRTIIVCAWQCPWPLLFNFFNIKERPVQGEWLRSWPAEAGSTKNPPAKYLNLRTMCL